MAGYDAQVDEPTNSQSSNDKFRLLHTMTAWLFGRNLLFYLKFKSLTKYLRDRDDERDNLHLFLVQ